MIDQATAARLLQLAEVAKPQSDEDCGTSRQVDAESALFDAIADAGVFADDEAFTTWCEGFACSKATPAEMITAAVDVIRAAMETV